MAAMKRIFSKMPSATRFFFPPENLYIVIEGTNSNRIGTTTLQPRLNHIPDYHWEFVKATYGKGDYPHYFGGHSGSDDAFYEEVTEEKAADRLVETKPARSDEEVVVKSKNVTKFNKDDDL